MKRRKFLIGTGAIITMSSLLYYGYSEFKENKENQLKRPDPNSFDQPILKGIAYGITASNPHNTQAWKFHVLHESELLLYVDSTRILPETDPTTRQIHIGCGCFIETLRIGMLKEKYRTQVEYFPDGNYQKKRIGEMPVARIRLIEDNSLKSSKLSEIILERRTSRQQFSNEVIHTDSWNTITELIGESHSKIELFTDSNILEKIRPVLSKGMSIESYTYRTYEESRLWFRENDDKIAATKDGINLQGNGISGIKKWFAERQLKGLSSEAWHDKEGIEYTLNSHNEKVMTSPNIVTLTTDTNNMIDWVKSGRDYSRLQLACQLNNFYMQPLSQVLQEFEEMKELRTQFEEIMGVNETQKTQMVLRVGRSSQPYKSYRRDVNSMIV